MTLWNQTHETTVDPAGYGKPFRRPTGSAGWNDDLINMLKRLWADGLSAAMIAGELGNGLTRNAVIGKVHRLGLERRRTVTFRISDGSLKRSSTPRPKRPRPERTPSVRVLKPVEIPVPIAPSLEHRVGFLQLDNQHCHYPLWTEDTPADEKFYCGTPEADMREGRPYCPFHCTRVYTKREAA